MRDSGTPYRGYTRFLSPHASPRIWLGLSLFVDYLSWSQAWTIRASRPQLPRLQPSRARYHIPCGRNGDTPSAHDPAQMPASFATTPGRGGEVPLRTDGDGGLPMHKPIPPAAPVPRRRQELAVFLVLTLVLAPALAIATVGGYGLGVWVYQMIAGPPGPPPKPQRRPGIVPH